MSNDPNAMRSQSNPYAAGGPVQEPVYYISHNWRARVDMPLIRIKGTELED
jgi:hypothetical protein